MLTGGQLEAEKVDGDAEGVATKGGSRTYRPARARLGRRLAVLAGLVFFLVVARSRGWIGEEGRVSMAGGLARPGRRGRVDARAACADRAAPRPPVVAGLFATLVVAGPGYDLVLRCSARRGGGRSGRAGHRARTALAGPGHGLAALLLEASRRRCSSTRRGIAGIALMLVAYVAAGAVRLWQRWHASRSRPSGSAPTSCCSGSAGHLRRRARTAALAALAVFGLARAVAAAGFEWRSRAPAAPLGRVLLALNALVLAGLGAVAAPAAAWLAALAAAHVLGGVVALRRRRVSGELALAGLAIGVVLADLALSQAVGELGLVAGWAAGAAGFPLLARVARIAPTRSPRSRAWAATCCSRSRRR